METPHGVKHNEGALGGAQSWRRQVHGEKETCGLCEDQHAQCWWGGGCARGVGRAGGRGSDENREGDEGTSGS